MSWASSRRALAAAIAAALAAGVVVLVPSNAAIWGKLHGTEVGRFVFSEDRTGVTLIRDAGTGRHLVLSNGKGLSWVPFGGPHTALGALPALLHPDPKRIAVIGLGSGDTCFSAGGNSASEEIVCIEITRSQVPVLEAFQRATPNEGIATLFQDPRFHHEATDGRAFVLRSREPFDIIELDPQSPNTAYTGNLYSYEFFDLMRRRLAPGGFAVTHRSTPRAIRAFVRAFPHLLAVGFDRRFAVLIGSNEPIHFDRRALLAKVRSDWQLREYYASAGVDIVRLFSGMVERPIGFLARYAEEGEYNTDLFPRDEFMTPERSAPKDAH